MGDFYLRMGSYRIALNWFSKAMLFRTVFLGAESSKTLDTALRFYVAAYARQREERELFEAAMKYMKDQYIEIGDKKWELIATEGSKGKADKYNQMRMLVRLGENSEDISGTITEMMRVLSEV